MELKELKTLNKHLKCKAGDILKWHGNLLQVKNNNRACNNYCFFRGKGAHCLFYCKNVKNQGFIYFNQISEMEALILKGSDKS